MNFWQFVRVLKNRALLIGAIVLVTLIVVALAAPKPSVVYRATVKMQPSPEVLSGGMSAASNSSAVAPDRRVTLNNLIILAKSPNVLERVLKFLSLDVRGENDTERGWPDFMNKPFPRVELGGRPVDANSLYEAVEVGPDYAGDVAESEASTNVIQITVKTDNPDAAPLLANAMGHAFSQAYNEASTEGTSRSVRILETSLRDTKAKLLAAQTRLSVYKRQKNVISVDAETQASLTAMTGFESEREAAVAELRQAEAAVADIDRQLASQPLVNNNVLPADMNPTVVRLKSDLSNEEANLQSLAQKYKPAHPLYAASQARIEFLKKQIAKAGQNYSQPIINEVHQALVKQKSDALYKLATAKARRASLDASVAHAQAKISNLAKAEPELVNLMTEYAQLDSTYKMISEKLQQTRLAEKATSTAGSIQTVSWAYSASQPQTEGPSRKALLIYAFFLSLILAIALCVWMDSIDNRLRNAADVEKLLGLPVLGLTPKLTGRDGTLPQLTHMYPLSAMAESYKILRTNILFAMRDNPFKTLMVATGRPGQGATTTVCNLAIALAQIGKRIILIDADMRRPSLHKFFGVPNEAGLSTLLQGTGNVTDAFQTTDVQNLILVPAGPQPMNPSELIGSERMREVVEKLQEHCDLVMFDTPSTIVFSDGPMLASWLDAVIMIVSANQAPRGTETITRDLLRRAKANILGVVVNRMTPENVDSCYYYSHYYSDSVAQPSSPQLGAGEDSGNGNKPKSVPAPKSKPKAIPAASNEQGQAESDDNPFPD